MRVLYGWGWAIAIAQFFNGSIETSLTPHYPALAARMHVGPAGLGLALAAFPLGLFIGTPLGGWIAHRWGARVALLIGATLFFGLPPLAGLAPTPIWFAAVLLGAAIGNGIFDVGWVLQSTGFEREHRHDPRLRDANLGFQALFSLGSLVGVGSAALALWLGWATFPHMLGVATVALLAVYLTARGLRPRPDQRSTETAAPEAEPSETTEPVTDPPVSSSGWLTFAGLCAASFLLFLPIGAAYAWSTLYILHLGAPPWLAAFGLVAYTLFEGVSRLAAWKWNFIKRQSRHTIVVSGALIALVGVVLVVGPGQIATAIVGFGLISLGFGPAGPIMQSIASHTASTGNRTTRVTIFTGVTYAAGVIGQPLIGGIAGFTSLRVAFMLLGVCALLVLALAKTVREPTTPGQD
jgi:MFS family permease